MSSGDVESTTDPGSTGYVLVHHVPASDGEGGGELFAPLRIMNPVTYLGRLPGNDVVLASTNVSRRHAKLIVTDLGVTVHDLDSHNGVFLNGKKVRSTPVAPGDLLYIGDVCVELRRSGDSAAYDGGSLTAVVHDDISDEDDPRARGFAALLRVSELCSLGGEESWSREVLQICRELVDATVAVLVEVHHDGDLATPVVLQPEASRNGPTPVVWEVVQKAISTLQPQFARDLAEANLVDAVKEGDARAVMAVPIMVSDVDVGAVVFLSRPQAGMQFSSFGLDAMMGIARLMGLRLERSARPAEITSVGDENDELAAAHARLMGAEEQLAAEQAEVERLTTRSHALEGENLKLRQQSDLDRQALQKQQTEKERELVAAHAEQKKQAQKEHAALQKEVERQKLEVEKHREAARAAEEHRRNRANDVEFLALQAAQQQQAQRAAAAERALGEAQAAQDNTEARLAEVETSLVVARGLLDAARDHEAVQAQNAVAAEQSDQAATLLRTALRASVLPMLVDHVEAVAAGEAVTTSAQARQLTVLYLALADFDGFCEKASVDDVKQRLDRFCAAISARGPANGGRIDQVIGHGHLLVFAADPASVLAAVRCAIEVSALVDADAPPAAGLPNPAVVAGVHTGLAIAGFFGGDDGVSYVEAGLPLVVARAAVEQAPPGKDGAARGVVVSETVRLIVATDPRFRVTRLGPAWVKGVNAPVPLALVEFDDENAR